MSPQELLPTLQRLNTLINQGRGSRVIADVIFYLGRNEPRAAAIRARTDLDKLYQYPEVYHLVKDFVETHYEETYG